MAKKENNFTSIIERISLETGIPKDSVRTILQAFFQSTISAVSKNDRVVLRGFGAFFSKTRKTRKYRDIRTGEIKETTPGQVPVFQPSRVLLRATRPISFVSGRDETAPAVSKNAKETHKSIHTGAPVSEEPVGECEVIVSSPNPDQTDDLRIGFNPCPAFDSQDSYPIVYSPAPDSYLKLPREGRSDIKGYKEPEFLAEIQKEFTDISVSDNLHLKIPGRYAPYEPDIVLYDESINLYIDVEIDEPYDGYSRLVTHILEGSDTIRDVFFKESGWVVVRFTERQVHLHPELCIQVLRNIVDTMRGVSRYKAIVIDKEPRWSRRQAVKWETELYREKYLGIQFFSKQVRTRKVRCMDGVEGIDLVINRTSLSPSDGNGDKDRACAKEPSLLWPRLSDNSAKGGFVPISQAHPSSLTFKDTTHSYSTPGDDTGNSNRISVTSLIDQFFPSFDEDAYIRKKMEETGMSEEAIRLELAEPSERGTDMHKQIENYLKGLPYDSSSREFQHFLAFYNEQILKRGLVFDSAEYAIELKESNIAGTVDALFRKPDGVFVMVDWKRSKHLIIDGYPKKYGFGRGLSVLSHLDNSSYYKYELQQSFYKYILEKDYGIRVSSMILAVLYPEYEHYYSIKLSEYRKREVLDMIESYEYTL